MLKKDSSFKYKKETAIWKSMGTILQAREKAQMPSV